MASYIISPAFKNLSCQVCGHQAHGKRFGAVCCLPCAAFFRRYVVMNCKYECPRENDCESFGIEIMKKCKDCRYQKCRNIGMKLNKIGQSIVDEEKEDFLDKFEAAYDKYILSQTKLFLNKYPELNIQQQPFFIPENVQQLHNFEISCKSVMFTMLNNNVENFNKLEIQEKNELFEACYDQLNFLNCLYLTAKNFSSNNSTLNNFMLAYGHCFDFRIAEKIIMFWAKDVQNKENYCKTKMAEIKEKYYLIKNFFEYSKNTIKNDCCALMLIILCNKASSMNFSSEEKLTWDNLKEIILREFHQHLCKKISSKIDASIHFTSLISLLVNLENHCLTKKKLSNEYSLAISPINNYFKEEFKELFIVTNFIQILKAHNRIWGAFYELPDSYISKFSSFNNILTSPDNILGYYESFNPNPSIMSEEQKQTFFTELNQLQSNLCHPYVLKYIIVSRLLIIGIYNALPFFRRLSRKDQLVLLNRKIGIVGSFIKSFNSSRMQSTISIGTDGLTPLDMYKAKKRYRENKQLMNLIENAYSRTAEPFFQISPLLDLNEFVLTLLILCSSEVPELSKHARLLLQTETEFYVKMLLKHCQQRFDYAKGACRYAECMRLIERAFYFENKAELLLTYLSAFYLPRNIDIPVPEFFYKVL